MEGDLNFLFQTIQSLVFDGRVKPMNSILPNSIIPSLILGIKGIKAYNALRLAIKNAYCMRGGNAE